MTQQMYTAVLDSLHWNSLSRDEKQLTTLQMKHHLEVEREHLSDSELLSKKEYLAILEYQRLKEMQSYTNLPDTLLFNAAVEFARIDDTK
jgi:Trm5-related predicted tRNA methylase